VSNHESVYEGVLNWPLQMGYAGITCRAPAGQSLPPWGLSDDGPDLPENPCGGYILGQDYLTLGDLRDAIEAHMRDAHGEQV
jgi:hypothetical protein